MRYVAIAFALFMQSGCVTENYVTTYYKSQIAGVPKSVVEKNTLPYQGRTRIIASSDINKDYQEALKKNYLQIGVSSFTAVNYNMSDDVVLSHGKKIEADLAIVYTGYVGAERGSRPVLNYNPGQTSTTYNQGNIYANAYSSTGSAQGNATYSGSSTTTTMGTYSMSQVAVTNHRYTYTVAFFKKGVTPVLGVRYDNLNDELRKKYSRNTGVVVTLVLYDTPAFRANIFPGDVIVDAGGIPIISGNDISLVVEKFAGKECEFTVLRDEEELSIPVMLNVRNG